MNTMMYRALHGAILASAAFAAPAFAGTLTASITTPQNGYSYNEAFTATIQGNVTGAAPTMNAQLAGTVPAGVALLGATAAGPWTCTVTGQAYDCDAASLPASGVQAAITLSLKAGAADAFVDIPVTASADSSPASTATTGPIQIMETTSGTCWAANQGPNVLKYQIAWTHQSAPLGYIENRPGVEGTYAFRLCNTTTTPRNNVIHTADFPPDVIPEPAHADSSPGWTCTAGPAGSTRCINATGETALSNGWHLGGAARREMHYRMASPFQPGAFSVEGPGCGTYNCPPSFDPYGLGYLASAAWDGGVSTSNWSVIPNGVNQTVVGFGTPTYFDKAGAAVSTWQPEGLALIPVTVTPIGDLNRSWLLHAIESADSAWMTEEAASAPGNGWSCVRGGKNLFPSAPTEFSTCRTQIPRTDRGVATNRVIALRASTAARATGSVDIQFCTGSGGQNIAGFDYGFGPTFNWGVNLGAGGDVVGHCNTITLPMGVTTPVSLQSFTIE